MQPAPLEISAQARIFLVAGARDIANFAQEVVDQKKFWLARGYAADQIECFYVAPDPAHSEDVEQFLSLEADLRDCHLATPQAVLGAIAQVAPGFKDKSFYFYLTSHGSSPLRELPDAILRRLDPQGSWLTAAVAEARRDPESAAYDWLSPYRMEVEGMERDADGGGGWISFLDRYENLHRRQGARAGDQLFTPALLASALRRFPEGVRKIVVLQGCHSGGFVLPPDEAPDPGQALVALEDLTVLTASRSDRTSFGCDGGGRTTYYGGSLQKVLEALPSAGIDAMDWEEVHRGVSREVRRLENDSGIAWIERSLPQYFSNHH